MDQKLIDKATELFARVIKLNEKAEGVFYNFRFGGVTKQVDFMKSALPSYEALYSVYSYLDKPELTASLEDIEALIAAEEESQKEEQK